MRFSAALFTVALTLLCALLLSGCDRLGSTGVTENVRQSTTTTTAVSNDPNKIVGEHTKPLKIGDIEWVTESIDTAFEVSDGSSSEQAAGKFIILEVTATAMGTDDATIDQTQLQVLDGLNRKFLPSAKIHALDKKSLIPFPRNPNEPVFENITRDVRKGEPVTAYVLFDVPSDALGLKFVVRDELILARDFRESSTRKSSRRGVIDLMPLLQ